MEENLDHLDEEVKASLRRYKDMLKNKSNYYFDVFEFEHIIDFYLDKNDITKADNVIKYALNIHPNSTSLLLKKAQAYINNGFPVKSLKLLKKLEKIEASNYVIFQLQGAVYCSLGDVNNAIEVFDKALSLTFDSIEDLLFSIGMTFKQISRFDLSNKYLVEAYKLDSKNIEVIYEMANNYEKLDEDEISEAYFKEYINIDPFSVLAWYSIGLVYTKLENYVSATQAFEYVIAIDPEHVSAYYQRAICLYYNEQIEASIDAFNEFLVLEKDNTYAIFHIGEAYAKLKNTKKAAEYFAKAIKINEKYADAWYGQAYLLYESKKYADSLHSIKRAIKYDAEDPDYWFMSALICQELGFIEEAEKSYKKTIELDNSDPKIWLEYSKLNFGQSKIYKTINILSEANELFENDADINYRLAGYLAIINNTNSAIFHLKQALEEDIEKLDIFKSIFNKEHEKIEEVIESYSIAKQKDNNKFG